jgi:hypothetical protein
VNHENPFFFLLIIMFWPQERGGGGGGGHDNPIYFVNFFHCFFFGAILFGLSPICTVLMFLHLQKYVIYQIHLWNQYLRPFCCNGSISNSA